MNILIENKYITQMECGANFAYILSENNSFLSTEYKVLQSQANTCFVDCMKMTFNGKIQLYYLTKGLNPFSQLLPTLDAESFLTISANLFSDIIEVKSNGFLSCCNVDLSFDRIYVDPTTYKVSLVYLPISKRIYDDDSTVENEIRTSLFKLISSTQTLSSSKTAQFAADLTNGTLKIEDLYAHIKGGKISSGPPIIDTPVPEKRRLRVVAMNAPSRVELIVDKDEFVIGKKPELCDGVVSFNAMISRSHCKIYKKGSQYMITDLQSANGTYVNKVRLHPNQSMMIQNGDIIRLANSDFQVIIE